jgi:hypothetical protein
MLSILGGILGTAAKTLIPFAAKKLASIPIANQVFRTVRPILGAALPMLKPIMD